MHYGHFVMSLFCAWVLWQSQPGNYGWLVYDTYETRKECLVDEVKVRNVWMNDMTKCLPDTIDPRAPKASR
jgi:hypothetical protein